VQVERSCHRRTVLPDPVLLGAGVRTLADRLTFVARPAEQVEFAESALMELPA
jgi:hypothetical protein